MTTAVCYNCGKFKTSAFVPCYQCGAIPKQDDDIVLSLALTDHFFDHTTLESMGETIQNGEKIRLDPKTHEVLLQKIKEPETASMIKWLKELF
ncbi:MAG: hypothetical protein M3142_06795 [Bacteroidota bacterium]|nr:hypothetical protein [Bacteroidota bacterium]